MPTAANPGSTRTARQAIRARRRQSVAADKVVFSSTLARVHTRRTRLVRQLDAQVVAGIKAASRGDLTIGGPTLAAEALRLDLVDVVELLWCPAMLGTGIPVLSGGVRRDLTLRRDRRFSNGMVQ